MDKVNWTKLEEKWRQRWIKEKDFEAEPDSREKKFITVAYPYPNSPQHVGHGRTYTTADVHARFLRMMGYNVLFPMAFHYTGTPILGMAKRVEAQDKEIINALEGLYGVPKEIVKGFVEPIKIADYFSAEIKQGMIEMGYSIDSCTMSSIFDAYYALSVFCHSINFWYGLSMVVNSRLQSMEYPISIIPCFISALK